MKKHHLITGLISAVLFCSVQAFADYEKALRLFEEQKYRESLTVVAEELTIADDFTPGSPNYKLRFLAAHNHWKLGNMESASAHFRRCMDIEKNNPAPYIDLALVYLRDGKIGQAESLASSGLKIKEDAMFYVILGRAAMAKKNYWRARDFFEKANSRDLELDVSYNGLGTALLMLKKYGEANTAFSAALSLNPQSHEILNNLALSFEKSGNAAEAAAYYEKALALDPGNSMIEGNLKRARAAKTR